MPNQFVPVKQVAQELMDAVRKAAKGDVQIERAIWYDLQTAFGGFPENAAERDSYITNRRVSNA